MIGDASPENRPGLILLVQGHTDPRWEKPFLSLKQRLAATLGEDRVYLAYLYHQSPTLLETALFAHNAGVRDVVVLPLFLALGGEIEVLIPRQVVVVKEKLPELNIVLLPPIGEHPSIQDEIYLCALKSVTTEENC